MAPPIEDDEFLRHPVTHVSRQRSFEGARFTSSWSAPWDWALIGRAAAVLAMLWLIGGMIVTWPGPVFWLLLLWFAVPSYKALRAYRLNHALYRRQIALIRHELDSASRDDEAFGRPQDPVAWDDLASLVDEISTRHRIRR